MKELIEQIEHKMKERNFMLYSRNSSYTSLTFTHQYDINTMCSVSGIFCEITIKNNEVSSFKLGYTIPKMMFFLNSGELGSFFNDNHFNKFFLKFCKVVEKLKELEVIE